MPTFGVKLADWIGEHRLLYHFISNWPAVQCAQCAWSSKIVKLMVLDFCRSKVTNTYVTICILPWWCKQVISIICRTSTDINAWWLFSFSHLITIAYKIIFPQHRRVPCHPSKERNWGHGVLLWLSICQKKCMPSSTESGYFWGCI